MAFLYGRAGRLTAKTGGFRPGQELKELEEAAFSLDDTTVELGLSHIVALYYCASTSYQIH
jgi:hypothetical protein